jgi:hypothetical protein
VRPLGRPLLISRGVRCAVARGSIEYSAVTHPRPLLRKKAGTPSLDGGRAQHARVSGLDQAAAFGGQQVVGFDPYRPELVRAAVVGAPWRQCQDGFAE